MGIARNGEIPEIEVDGKRFEVKQSHPRTAENARNGGSGQLRRGACLVGTSHAQGARRGGQSALRTPRGPGGQDSQ